MLVGIGAGEEQYNDAAVSIAFGTFKGQEDQTRALLGDDYYVDALKVCCSLQLGCLGLLLKMIICRPSQTVL
jgi:hypothetical protein